MGEVQAQYNIKEGNKFVFDQKDVIGDENRVYLSHKEIYNCVKKTPLILIDAKNQTVIKKLAIK